MSRHKVGGMAVVAVLALAAAFGLELRAQGQRDPSKPSYGSVQEALVKPFHFSFAKPTPLEDVAKSLAKALNAPVVIDRAAIDRSGLKMSDEVQLELDAVRLKTGLKLLLDQLDLTYRVVPEDNLLIITDAEGSADPLDLIHAELKALHRDLHAVQDSIDDIHDAMGLDEGGGAKLRKPTIIEDMPAPHADEKDKPKDVPPATSLPRSRPGA